MQIVFCILDLSTASNLMLADSGREANYFKIDLSSNFLHKDSKPC